MNFKNILMATVLFFILSCGATSSGKSENSSLSEVPELNLNSTFKHSAKTVTIYVHGFEKGGFELSQGYGDDYANNFTDKLAQFTPYPKLADYDKNNFTNVLTSIEYYGDEAPSYYDESDINDMTAITEQYEGGIPRYALIVAKYAKHILKETGAKRVNLVSVSMGSLIVRWLIEKNVENLASEKKIEKWMTAEGLIRGNYGYTKIASVPIIPVHSFVDSSAETTHMTYSWIEENLIADRDTMKSPYYADILVGQISMTDSEKEQAGLKYILIEEGFQANDGYQLVKDTYFGEIETSIQSPSHTLVHIDHVSIDESDVTFRSIANFLEAKKRVRITLLDVNASDIHESITTLNTSTETVFQSTISSSQGLLCERVYAGATLNVYSYTKNNENLTINQILFDDFVQDTETTLLVKIKGYELDRSSKYSIAEVSIGTRESMGESTDSILIENGIYEVSAEDWIGRIKVEVLEM